MLSSPLIKTRGTSDEGCTSTVRAILTHCSTLQHMQAVYLALCRCTWHCTPLRLGTKMQITANWPHRYHLTLLWHTIPSGFPLSIKQVDARPPGAHIATMPADPSSTARASIQHPLTQLLLTSFQQAWCWKQENGADDAQHTQLYKQSSCCSIQGNVLRVLCNMST